MAFLLNGEGMPADHVGRITKALDPRGDDGLSLKSALPSFLSMGLAGVLLNSLMSGDSGSGKAQAPSQPVASAGPETFGMGAPASGGFGRIGRDPRRGG
jgi:hypothetical protein